MLQLSRPEITSACTLPSTLFSGPADALDELPALLKIAAAVVDPDELLELLAFAEAAARAAAMPFPLPAHVAACALP